MIGDTIFALSSGRPPAGIAVVRISGPRALAAGEQIAGSLPAPRLASVRTLRDPASGTVLDEALVLRFDRPGTATGEDIVEFQCHGGRAVVSAILTSLGTVEGLRLAEPGEFTRRALTNGRIDLTEAEGLADLLEAETESQRRAALMLAGGGLSRLIAGWRERLVDLSAQAEAAIDYVGDEEETAVDPAQLILGAKAIADEIGAHLAAPRIDPLREGLRVVVAGPPNVGKSSLINAMSRSDRAIVTDIAGTTRDVIEVPMAIAGIPITLVDTAGIRDSDDRIERIGISLAQSELERADIIVWMGDSREKPFHRRVLVVRSKADIEPGGSSDLDVHLSATTGIGIPALVDRIVDFSRDILPVEGAIAVNERQATQLQSAYDALARIPHDILIAAEALRLSLAAIDRLTGRLGVEDVLDGLFGRFCLGK